MDELPFSKPSSSAHRFAHDKNGRGWGQLDISKDEIAVAGNTTPRAQSRSAFTTNRSSKTPSVNLKNQLLNSVKRPGDLPGSIPQSDAAKRQKLPSSQLPQRSNDSSLPVRDTPSGPFHSSSKLSNASAAPKPMKSIFMEISDDSDDDKATEPISRQLSPLRSSLPVAHRSLEVNGEAALARSKFLRQQAEKAKLADKHFKPPTWPTASIARRQTVKQEQSPPTPSRRSQKSKRKDVRSIARPKPEEVISRELDEEVAPITPLTMSRQRQPQTTKPQRIARETPKTSLFSSEGTDGPSTFTQRLQEVKKEHPLEPEIRSRRPVQHKVELANSVSTNFETEQNKQQRLGLKTAEAASQKLERERQQSLHHARLVVEQQNKKREADERIRRQQEERERAQRAEDAKARLAELQRRRQQNIDKQRLEYADQQRNRAIDEQLRVSREETRKKKAEAEVEAAARKARVDAELARKKARDDAEKEAARTRRAALAAQAPILDEQARRDRDERIRLKKERAIRNKQTEREEEVEDEDQPHAAPKPKPKGLAATVREARLTEKPAATENVGNHDNNDGPAAYRPTPHLSAKQPISLHSAAGANALSGGSRPMQQPSGIKPRVVRDKQRPLGEIHFEDAKLLQWRDTGESWSAISTKFAELTGKKRAEDTLRRRYSTVSKALSEARVGSELKRRMVANDEEARMEVNVAVHGEWPIGSTANTNAANTVPIKSVTPQVLEVEPEKAFHEKDNKAKRNIDNDPHHQWVQPQKAAPATAMGSSNTLTTGSVPPGLIKGSLGEILPIDALIICWRREGMGWAQVVEKYRAATGIRKSDYTLKLRVDEVEPALNDAVVFPDELEALSRDAPGARAKVNKKVWKTWPPVPEPVSEQEMAVAKPLDEPAARPTTGGKTITWDIHSKYLEDREAADAELSDVESASEIDEDNPQDSYYYYYRVYRREYTLEDEEDGIQIQDVEWRECNEFENPDEANQAAAAEISQQVQGRPNFQEGRYTLEHDSHNGFQHLTLVNAAVGQLDVIVSPVVRIPEERILPSSKEGWLHNSLYYVKQAITHIKYTVDDVLGETHTETVIREKEVEGTHTSFLDQANLRAVTHFVKLTRPKSVNLDQNSLEQANRVECLLAELRDRADAEVVGESGSGQEIMFRGVLDDDDDGGGGGGSGGGDGGGGGKDESMSGQQEEKRKEKKKEKKEKVEVWVVRTRLTGPRNLYKFSK